MQSVQKEEKDLSEFEGIHEECGVFGMYAPCDKPLARYVYYGLVALQHRGQESAGIAVNKDRVIHFHKGLGLVHEVFSEEEINKLGDGNIAVGHVRYSTSGDVTMTNAQPLVIRHVKGQLALTHNGNLVNSYTLRHQLELEGCIFQTTSDTEVISYLITRARLKTGSIEQAVNAAMNDLEGAYSLVLMSPSKLIAVRDPHGFRPLCYGLQPDGTYVFASETCALDAVGAEYVRDLDPGEIVVVSSDGIRSIRDHCEETPHNICIFEYIYFARPDSVVQGVSIHEARVQAGRFLAQEHPADADLVIGVPDSGLNAAIGYSIESGIPYRIGLIKNKYIGRTFIAPSQEEREQLVRLKLNTISDVIRGRRVVLIDDSIVRGTTSKRLIQLVRSAGAREVHMRISAPPFTNPCYYGTDVDSKENLIANHHTIPEICQIIGADTLGYLSIEKARKLAGPYCDHCCDACFSGNFPTRTPDMADKRRFE